MSIKDNKSSETSENIPQKNKGFQILKEYEYLFRQTDQYPKDLALLNKNLDLLDSNNLFLRRVKFTMMDRILAQRRKNTREQNMKKIYSIIKQYLKDKRGIKGFYKVFFKIQKIKFNQKNLKDLLTSQPLKNEVINFLQDEIAFKNYSLQYVEEQSNNFIQNYKINFQKYLFANKKEAFIEYLKNAKKAKYPWTYQMVDKARLQFIDFFFKNGNQNQFDYYYYLIYISKLSINSKNLLLKRFIIHILFNLFSIFIINIFLIFIYYQYIQYYDFLSRIDTKFILNTNQKSILIIKLKFF